MKKKLLYWIPTLIFLAPMFASGIYYFVDTPTIVLEFEKLGYPTYTIYFNAIAKILGTIAMLFKVPAFLKEFAYAGFLYILLMALQALYLRHDESIIPMFVFIVAWGVSYWQYRVQKA